MISNKAFFTGCLTIVPAALSAAPILQSINTDMVVFCMLTLFVVIFLSTTPKNQEACENACNLTSQLDHYSHELFKHSSFPTALMDLDLRLIDANLRFQETCKITSYNDFDMLANPVLKNASSLLAAVQQVKKTRFIPEKPMLLFIDFDFQKGCKTEAGYNSYALLRRLYPDNRSDQKLVLIIIDTEYSKALTTNLLDKIAQKDQDFKKLEELDQLKSEFLATLSHELKTPLVSIKGYLDLMASEKMGPLTEKQEKALRVSLKNTSHLNTLISSILNFARMEAGKLRFDLTNQKLLPHLNDILDSLRPIADNRQISLQLNAEEDLPMVVIDAELIHRVMINLIENAIKFSSPGSIVVIEAVKDNIERIKVKVKDKGKGIPADKLEKIKTPFFQADKSDTRPTGGLGLGLAIAEKILVGHGTSLSIESQENAGTTCSFYLKIAPPRI